jgi:uncharacterized protein YigE (DUF2233 family)
VVQSKGLFCAALLLWLVSIGTAHAESCRSEVFRGASYTVCSFDPSKDDLRILWRNGRGTPCRTFSSLAEEVKDKGKSVRFAMNGGMY